MPKVKKHRMGVRMDMTAMVDVAFLLLTFFMLTTQFRPPEEVTVELPDSHSQIKLPEKDVITISVSNEGKVFMGVDSQHLRARLFGVENALKSAVLIPDMEQLKTKLVEARISNSKLRTVIKSDRLADYGPVMDVMKALEDVKITRFNLVTNLEKT